MAYQTENLRPTSINGVKMYTGISQNRPLSTWFDPKKRRALRKDKDYMQRVELIQDMRFETATSRIKATPDGEYFIASGIYPPQVKVYECSQLALKFERHLVSEIINFEVLSDDYSKMAFLCADRSVCLHAKYGSHYSLRIPRMGRDIEYDCWSCDLICAASSPELYRINLEQGRFVSPLNTKSPAVNVVSRSEVHGLVACGGEDGAVECFDMRVKSSAGRIHADDDQVTAIEFDGDGGYYMAVGSGSGKVLIYDLRASKPFQEKDHMYSSPILSIKWHKSLNYERPKLITTDEHIVKIWDPESGEIMTSIEPTAGRINDLCISKGSGLIFLALDSSQIPYYFIPALGLAPKWCSSLENLTEELEEKAETTRYVNFTFLTKDDLVKLNLANLIGTDVLKPCMHGFLMDCKLYQKVQAVANPFAYESYREQKKQLKIEEERASRITIKKKLPKVNRRLAAQLHENEVTENEKREAEGADSNKKAKKKKGLTTDVMKDERFAAMFEDKEFEIDEFSEEYLALHPILATTKKPSLIDEHFEPIMEDDDQSDVDVSTASQSSEDEDADDKTISKKRSRVPRLYEVKDERHAEAYWKNVSLAKEDSLSLEERVAALRNKQQTENGSTDNTVKIGPGGSREISFTRRSSAKYVEDDEDDREEIMPHKKRGIQSLKLKPDRSGFQGGGGRWRGGGGDRGRGRGGGGRGRGRGRRGRGGRF